MPDDGKEKTARESTYVLSRWLFLRLLGVTYLIAFVSLWIQIDGLICSTGILPAEKYLEAVRQNLGVRGYRELPTLCWFNCSDSALHCFCAVGTVLSVLLIVGIAPVPVLLLLWVIYLSLSLAGQAFLSFQWDTLLLETGFFAMFYAPLNLLPRISQENPPPAIGRWLLWWLLFKLMFLSGITKLLWADPKWLELNALDFHYFTQPIPNSLSWYAHQLPAWWQKLSVVVMFAIELFVPFLILTPPRFRRIACFLMIGLQVGITVTGNYGFFNLLAIVLCVSLLDDDLLRKFTPKRWAILGAPEPDARNMKWRKWTALALAVPLILASLLTFLNEMVRTPRKHELSEAVASTLEVCDEYVLKWGRRRILKWTTPFRTINGYGLFRTMTSARPEITIEGSSDGTNWKEYEFCWKAGRLSRRPSSAVPHMPRLDWQMWFAALNPQGNEYWLVSLSQKLLEGSPEVLRLLDQNPFPEGPPKYIRLLYYRYEFTDSKEKRIRGTWWKRTLIKRLTGDLSLR